MNAMGMRSTEQNCTSNGNQVPQWHGPIYALSCHRCLGNVWLQFPFGTTFVVRRAVHRLPEVWTERSHTFCSSTVQRIFIIPKWLHGLVRDMIKLILCWSADLGLVTSASAGGEWNLVGSSYLYHANWYHINDLFINPFSSCWLCCMWSLLLAATPCHWTHRILVCTRCLCASLYELFSSASAVS
jgi:hypothetical protein